MKVNSSKKNHASRTLARCFDVLSAQTTFYLTSEYLFASGM